MNKIKCMGHHSDIDRYFMELAMKAALKAEENGNLPIGALIVLDERVLSIGLNSVREPDFHPGRHAEIEALRRIPVHYWPQRKKMVCYTTLEPCVMCFGSLLLHGVGRIVFGGTDPQGGAGVLLKHLPKYYKRNRVPEWIGPILPEKCDPLYKKAAVKFEQLICT